MGARWRWIEPIAEILGFVGNQPVAELHDAHRIGWDAVMGKDEFRDPEITATGNSPDREPLLVWLQETAFLNVSSTVDPLARLRIIKHGILAVDFMLDFEVACIRSIPMALQGLQLTSIIHLDRPM